jgi:hypothetical protein
MAFTTQLLPLCYLLIPESDTIVRDVLQMDVHHVFLCNVGRARGALRALMAHLPYSYVQAKLTANSNNQ